MVNLGTRAAFAFWAATAKLLFLDPLNPILSESGWWEEQFDAPFDPLGPSVPYGYFQLPYNMGWVWPGANWAPKSRNFTKSFYHE